MSRKHCGKRRNCFSHSAFKRLTLQTLKNQDLLRKGLNLDVTELKAFADNKLKVARMVLTIFHRVENTVKRRKCWLPAFTSYPTVFSKASFFRVVKSLDSVVKG